MNSKQQGCSPALCSCVGPRFALDGFGAEGAHGPHQARRAAHAELVAAVQHAVPHVVEAEAAVQIVAQPAATGEMTEQTDAAFAELGTNQVAKIVAADNSSGQSTSAGPIINVADDDHDEDDGLDLFADDVLGQWN